MRAIALFVAVASLSSPVRAADGRGGPKSWCATTRHGLANALAQHQQAVSRRPAPVRIAAKRPPEIVGQTAILRDEGDMVEKRNLLDLAGAGLELVPQKEGYAVSRVDRPFTAGAGTPVSLGDDANQEVALPFSFVFYGKTYDRAFINSDGNLTFGAGESSSSARNLGRLLSGPPRIGPLFTDLDPSKGGSISTRTEGDAFIVTWSSVPYFDTSGGTTSFQVSLERSGRIRFVYDKTLSPGMSEGVVGVAPGDAAAGFTPVDLSTAASVAASGAAGESFAANEGLDVVSVARHFLRDYPDDFDQIVIFTSRQLLRGTGAFAYELTVKNTDQGIGFEMEDSSAAFGSAGRLESVVMMDYAFKYPADPHAPAAGVESALSVLGQEAGHRWLTRAQFLDDGQRSNELLGRDLVHWSFFMDTDASHLEGNDIEDLGGGQFRTVGAGLRYSALDQYMMGIRPPQDVPPFFFVRSPTGTAPGTDRDPQVGVTFAGTRKDVTIDDVIAALGPRNPPAGSDRPPWRQAFVFVAVGEPNQDALARVEGMRTAWEPFFAASTAGRRTVTTTLR